MTTRLSGFYYTQWATLLYIVPDFEYNNPQLSRLGMSYEFAQAHKQE